MFKRWLLCATVTMVLILIFVFSLNKIEENDNGEFISYLPDQMERICGENIQTLEDRIKNGDFSCLLYVENRFLPATVEDEEAQITVMSELYEQGQNTIQWEKFDINGDGTQELIWEHETADSNIKRIQAVFTMDEDEASCIFFHTGQESAFYFLNSKHQLCYYYQSCETWFYNRYDCYTVDRGWNKSLACSLEKYKILEAELDRMSGLAEWERKYGEPAAVGVHYGKYVSDALGDKEAGSYIQVSQKEFYEEFQNQMGFVYPADTWEIELCLYANVPELKAYETWICEKSQGKASFITETKSGPEEIYIDGNVAGRYYFIYVGEQWDDHNVNWDWFLVSENMDEVLWYDLIEGKYQPLEEWRASDNYRDWL